MLSEGAWGDIRDELRMLYNKEITPEFLEQWLRKRLPLYIEDFQREKEVEVIEEEKLVGSLNKEWGLKGYVIAKPGHPVFEFKDMYVIYLEHPTLPKARIPFYKETLKPAINFIETKAQSSP